MRPTFLPEFQEAWSNFPMGTLLMDRGTFLTMNAASASPLRRCNNFLPL